jgi:hypothetical protein
LVPRASNHSKHIGGGVFHSILPDTRNDDEEFTDVCAIEFEPDKYKIENLRCEFFPVLPDECWPSNSLDHLIVFGSPTDLKDWRFSEGETQFKLIEMNVTTVVVMGRHYGDSHARFVREAKMQRNNSFRADGMSGGPVFHLGRDASGFFVGLAGMIQRGGATSDNFRFIAPSFLRKFAET